jgi:GxxExxY protein
MELLHAETTGQLIELFYYVYKSLGYGFLESVYSKAMMAAGRKRGMEIERHVWIDVHFDGAIIGRYQTDLIVNNCVIVELKSASSLAPEHQAQLLNYLKATKYEVGLLFNFGPKAQYKRMVFDNARKGSLSWVSVHPRPSA